MKNLTIAVLMLTSVAGLAQTKKYHAPTLPTAHFASSSCDTGLSITAVLSDGKILKLDDGSVWEVSDVDTVYSALWTAGDDVVVCDDKITNTDDEETVEVTRIR